MAAVLEPKPAQGAAHLALQVMPSEIILDVADWLDEPSLLALMRTSRRLFAELEAALYRIAVRRNRLPLLHWAAERGNLRVAEKALAAGADPNQLWWSEYPRYILRLADNIETGKTSMPATEWLDQQEFDPVRHHIPRSFVLNHLTQRRAEDDRAETQAKIQHCTESGSAGYGLISLRDGLAQLITGRMPGWRCWQRYGLLDSRRDPRSPPARGRRHPPPGLLLSLGATSVNRQVTGTHIEMSRWRWAPLHLAVYHGHAALAALLLQKGADVHLASVGVSECSWFSIIVRGQREYTRSWTPLYLAVRRRHRDVCRLLAAHGAYATVASVPTPEEPVAFGPLHLAAYFGCLGLVKMFVEEGLCSEIDARDDTDKTPVVFAVKGGHLKVAEYLVKLGANLSLPYKALNRPAPVTLVEDAARDEDFATVNWLLLHGAHIPSPQPGGPGGVALLQMACERRMAARRERPFAPPAYDDLDSNNDESQQDDNDDVQMAETAEATATPENDRLRLIRRLLQVPSEVERINNWSGPGLVTQTPLGCALIWLVGNFDDAPHDARIAVDMLLAAGARLEPGPPEFLSMTPLRIVIQAALSSRAPDAVVRLRDFLAGQPRLDQLEDNLGPPPRRYELMYLEMALRSSEIRHHICHMLRVLLQAGARVDDRGIYGETVLGVLFELLETDSVHWFNDGKWESELVYALATLQDAGASLDTPNDRSITPLDRLRALLAVTESETWSNFQQRNREQTALQVQRLVQVCGGPGQGSGTRLRFRRPRVVFEDLPGDNLIQRLVADDDLWLRDEDDLEVAGQAQPEMVGGG